MAFCDHCEGQRFDRARILRLLRSAKRRAMREQAGAAVDALQAALTAVREMDVPHLERLDDIVEGEMVH
jgi:hypothetical protein